MKLLKLFSKREPSVSSERVSMSMMSQWTPLELLTPRILANVLDQFKSGEVSTFSRIWDDVRQRDDLIASVEPKRRRDVSRLNWEISLSEDSKAAKRQSEIVKTFFENIRYEDVLDDDKSQGISGLIRGMMLSVGFGWSVQEIVWNPDATGLTATFRQVPLWFFERRHARLRYLKQDGDYDGVELEEGGWLVTSCDDKLGIASLVLYLFKHMPLRDWLIYCHRYVVPGLHGKTTSEKFSTEWNDLRNTLSNFGQDWVMLTGKEIEVKPVDASSKGELPYGPLVDRCDRRLAGLWRGGDLSSMSAKDQTGASLQGSETDTLTADDAVMIEEVINTKLIPLVIRYTLGNATPLVKFQLQRTNAQTKQDLDIYDHFFRWGVPVSIADVRDRFGVSTPSDTDETIFVKTINANRSNDRMPYTELSGALAPVRDAIKKALESSDDDLPNVLAELQRNVPELFDQVNADKNFPAALSALLASAVADGIQTKPEETTQA